MFLKKMLFLIVIMLPFVAKAQDEIRETLYRSSDESSINFRSFYDKLTSADYENSNHYWHFYKIEMRSGDKLFVNLESDNYGVKMELYNSKNEFIGQSTDTFDFDYESTLEIIQPVSYDDEYILGISSADDYETGYYNLSVAVASPQSISFSGSEICDKISFLMKHKNADYAFIAGDKISDDEDDWYGSVDYSADIKLFDMGDAYFSYDDLLGTAYVQNGIYKNGNFDYVKSEFDKYAGQLNNCIPSDWTTKMDSTINGLPEFTASEPGLSENYLTLKIRKDESDDLYSLDFLY